MNDNDQIATLTKQNERSVPTRPRPYKIHLPSGTSLALLPLVYVGWVFAVDDQDNQAIVAYQNAAKLLHDYLSRVFPRSHWQIPFLQR